MGASAFTTPQFAGVQNKIEMKKELVKDSRLPTVCVIAFKKHRPTVIVHSCHRPTL